MAPPPPIRQNYTQEDLILAINAVRKDELSLREAQNMYNVHKDNIRRNKSLLFTFVSYVNDFVNIYDIHSLMRHANYFGPNLSHS